MQNLSNLVSNLTNAASSALQDTLESLLGEFSSASRLYALEFSGDDSAAARGELMVEAFAAHDSLHGIGARDVIVLATRTDIPLKSLLGKTASLQISLSDGSRASFTGLVNQAALLGSNGSLARYRLRLVPWVWLLSQCRNSRVWQDKSVVDIIESVFAGYEGHAAWLWS